MKKTIVLFAAMAALLATACKKSEILSPDNHRYIYINYSDPAAEKQVINFSFVSTPLSTAQIDIPLRFAGRALTKDLPFAIGMLNASTETSLQEGTEYELPELVFRTGAFEQTLSVTVHRTARMESGTFSLEFNLVSNEHFLATQTNYLHVKLLVTAQISKPIWWTDDITSFYLGDYSNSKFELFSQHGYTGDYGALDDSQKRYYALQFKYWLQDQPTSQVDENGNLIKVPIQG